MLNNAHISQPIISKVFMCGRWFSKREPRIGQERSKLFKGWDILKHWVMKTIWHFLALEHSKPHYSNVNTWKCHISRHINTLSGKHYNSVGFFAFKKPWISENGVFFSAAVTFELLCECSYNVFLQSYNVGFKSVSHTPLYNLYINWLLLFEIS